MHLNADTELNIFEDDRLNPIVNDTGGDQNVTGACVHGVCLFYLHHLYFDSLSQKIKIKLTNVILNKTKSNKMFLTLKSSAFSSYAIILLLYHCLHKLRRFCKYALFRNLSLFLYPPLDPHRQYYGSVEVDLVVFRQR